MDYQNAEFYKLNNNNPDLVYNFADELITYPSEWEKSSFGVSLEVRKKRDALFKFMSEQDIITQGTVVENPLIGNIPSRQMVEDELEELLMCM